MSGEDNSWRTPSFRQNVVTKIEEAVRNSGMNPSKNSLEMENHVFQKAKSKEDYLSYVARLILHVREMGHNNSPFPPLPYWPEDETVSQCGAKNGNLVPESTVEPNPSNATNFGNSTGRPKRKESDPVGAATIDNLADGKKMKKAADEPESQSDGDEKFLLSLKDDMKEMTPSQKRTFKRRIFEVLDDILQAPSSSSSGPCPISTSTS